jgi:hypothetical protein
MNMLVPYLVTKYNDFIGHEKNNKRKKKNIAAFFFFSFK